MNAIGSIVAAQLWKLLQPWLEAQWKEHGPEIIEKAKAFFGDQFKEWMPKLMEATVVAQLAAAEKLASGTVDKITDAIPGTADDKLIDPIVHQVFGSPVVKDFLGTFGIRL